MQRDLFFRHLAQTSPAPMALEAERAEGSRIFLKDGSSVLDLISGISVSNIGHGHPRVLEAVGRQMSRYMHLMVYGELIQSPQVLYAQALCNQLPAQLNQVYFTNSGAEATEGAMKLAKRATGRSRFIAFHKSYHGSTQGALSLLGDEYFRAAYRPLLPGISHFNYGDFGMIEQISCRTAAVFVEPVQAESGVCLPPPGFLKALRERCDQTGTLLVFDEIQTGMGRTGSLFRFMEEKVQPDILLSAKALGGGMPLGAFISSQELMSGLKESPVLGHITTFGGHPLSCAAGLAALEVILDENLPERAEQTGALMESMLRHPKIKAVRRAGLLMAVELESADAVQKSIERLLQRALFTDWFLFAPHCLRLAPPLNLSAAEAQLACREICAALDEI